MLLLLSSIFLGVAVSAFVPFSYHIIYMSCSVNVTLVFAMSLCFDWWQINMNVAYVCYKNTLQNFLRRSQRQLYSVVDGRSVENRRTDDRD